ncbi:hypothetical protein [Borreliella burgdorferi]|uniref:Uncharacterized protein n=1 Tax=Borreliella burgdorferi 118a TaxID=476210 RepID=A0A7U3YBP3_BORBG|nr:hypothetical protein [Borreliella burgdorferi]ACN24096.1 conserved hypothetical protein [Borreliella burgdorferi 64b]ACN56248.1 conserved hypothetical protein [Borreliella burgdorferi CA-11.2A]ACN93056.1 conserved hypothetical protein [Borreliella burgdorferi 118a]AXK69706.1 hypothetical protein BbuMM1_H260 [Borreliella burgdorferi]MCD2371541.1 hypothetical protein [Borreliella burgdorferi]
MKIVGGGYVIWTKPGNLSVIKDKYNNLIQDLAGLKYYLIIFYRPSISMKL